MRYVVEQSGESRSFPQGDAFLAAASRDGGEIVVYLGKRVSLDKSKAAILVELTTECLVEHIAEDDANADNVLGFARYRNGSEPPSNLIELVRLTHTAESAGTAAKALFESAGLKVAVCTDQPGRILDRLLRPKYNAALRLLDEGLATAADMDTTCKLGLGYPDGPIERVMRGGLGHHYRVTQALFETYGTPAYAPPRRAVAAGRRDKS